MKVKDLIKVLQSVDPESELSLEVGYDKEYREKCAKAELAEGECLNYFYIDQINICEGFNDCRSILYATAILFQTKVNLADGVKVFNEMYAKNKNY